MHHQPAATNVGINGDAEFVSNWIWR